MRFGFQRNDSDSVQGKSFGGSFRRSKNGVSPDRRSCISSSSKSITCSKRGDRGLKEYLKLLVDVDVFSDGLEDWVLEKTCNSTGNTQPFKPPFTLDELRRLDYALEGVLFQQLVRMPCSRRPSDECKEEQFLALEGFFQAIIDGLWRTFWQTSGPLPFTISCPRYPGSRFYTVGKAISNGRVGGLIGAAVAAKVGSDMQVQWDHILELALFKTDIGYGTNTNLSPSVICEAIFYGFHLLLSRTVSKLDDVVSSSVHLLVVDSKFGVVIKFGGDLTTLKIDSRDPYLSVVEWIKRHAEVSVSPVDRIWNKLGNANWGDLGTLQLLMATFNSISHWKGPPRKSIASLVAEHSLRLQKRRMEYNSQTNKAEMFESAYTNDKPHKQQDSYLHLNPSEVILLEDSQKPKAFQIKKIHHDVSRSSYIVVSLDRPDSLLSMYVGVHPSRLEPSWEGMSLWYQVQRQTKVLNTMKQNGISSKNLPELIASGRMLHDGPCSKPNPGDLCDHPRCGIPILVTSPVGESLSSIMSTGRHLPSDEALRCCRDILTALRSASLANIQHGEICPENIIRVDPLRKKPFYVLVSWGRAVLEYRDSPAMNLHFSSMYVLQNRKLLPSSDVESLIYLVYFVCGGPMWQMESIESALRWRERGWAKRRFQQHLGEVSTLLKAFTDYVDSLCGTPYPVDYDIWLRRLNRAVDGFDRGKSVEIVEASMRLEDVAESSRTSY